MKRLLTALKARSVDHLMISDFFGSSTVLPWATRASTWLKKRPHVGNSVFTARRQMRAFDSGGKCVSDELRGFDSEP